MKFDITRDQHDRRIIQCDLPVAGYFLIRHEGWKPVLSLEEPWYSRLRPLFRVAGVLGLIFVIIDMVTFRIKLGGFGVVLLILALCIELIDITHLAEHQVLRASAETININEYEGEIETGTDAE